MIDILKIEKIYTKQLSEMKEWNYVRNYYRIGKNVTHSKDEVYHALKSTCYGFFSWFRKYDYLVFSSILHRKLIEGKQYDIKSDYIIDILGKDKTLLIEQPTRGHHHKNIVYTKNIVSRRLIDLVTTLAEKFSRARYSNDTLEELNEKYEIDIHYDKIIRRFDIQYKVYKLWFKIIKPKYIFLNCFYDKQYIIKAAHEQNIIVIDIQHGLIGEEHSAYKSNLRLDLNYFPDKLFVFGEEDKKVLSSSSLFKKSAIFPIGNYYLEYLNNNFKRDQHLDNLLKTYTHSVGVSLQWTVEEELVGFIDDVAKKLPHVAFILIPREKENIDRIKKLNLSKNVMTYPKLDCYQIILHCDYHCTVYSTCAVEVPTLGIPNILININNMTTQYLHTMQNNDYTFIVNTQDELVVLLHSPPKAKKIDVIRANSKNFIYNYTNNVRSAIDKL